MTLEINAKVIEAELQELTPVKVSLKLNKHLEAATSIRETDKSYAIQLNPSKIRCQDKLDRHLNFCREVITHFQ